MCCFIFDRLRLLLHHYDGVTYDPNADWEGRSVVRDFLFGLLVYSVIVKILLLIIPQDYEEESTTLFKMFVALYCINYFFL